MKIKRIIAALLCAAMLSPTAFAQQGESDIKIISSEDFSGGMQGWINSNKKDFYVLGGELRLNNKGSSDSESVVVSEGMSIDNGEFEFDLNIKEGRYFAAFFRYTDENTHYALRFYPDSGRTVLLKKVGGGSYTELKKGKSISLKGKKVSVRVSLIDEKISVYADGEQLIEVTDKSIKKGKIAFSGVQADAAVDNVKIFRYNDVEYQKKENESEASALKVYIATDGNDITGDGSLENPYQSVDKAKEAVKKLKRKGLPIDVILRGGTYRLDKDIVFEEMDGGTENAPVRYMSYEGEQAVLSGATEIDSADLVPVKGEMKDRLKDNVKNKVRQIDLNKYGMTADKYDFRRINDFPVSQNLKPLQVTLNGAPQTIARYPNYGYNTILDCNGGKGSPMTIYYIDNIPTRWVNAKDMYLEGLFAYDWHSEWTPVDKIDISQNAITTKYNTAYGSTVGGRWAAVNLIEELDIPGEWYIDFDTMTMYYYPPYELDENDSLEISTSINNIITIAEADYLTLENLKLTMSCDDPKLSGASHIGGNGIYVYAGSNNILIKDCEIVNIGMHGIFVNSTDVTIDGCVIRNTGFMGVQTRDCGDRQNLIPSNVAIRNCDISEPGRDWTMTSSGCIVLADGSVDVLIENNLLHNSKNSAIRYNGVGHTIRNNEIYNAVTKAADAGAIYAGRNWTEYGVKVEYNFLHDIGQKINNGGYPASAIFWDDQQNGGEFSHNISVVNNKVKTSAVKIGGGVDNIVKGNTIVSSQWDIIGEDRVREPYTEETLKSRETVQRYSLVNVNNKAYLSKYPKMSTIVDRIRANGMMVKYENVITDNLSVDCPDGDKVATVMKEDSDYARNVSAEEDYSIFVNPEKLDYRVKKSAKEKYNISDEILDEDFDIETIGIQGERKLKDEDMKFIATYPENNSSDVSVDRTVLAWSKAPMADQYRYTVAEDSDFNNIVASGITEDFGVALDNLERGKTYYWKVTAENMSRQFGTKADASNGIMTFTVAEVSAINTSALEVCVEAAASAVSGFKEGTNPGDYRVGSVKSLKELIKQGQTILKNSTNQVEVDEITYKINTALKNIDGYINPGYTTLNFTASAEWLTNNPNNSKIIAEEGSARFETTSGTEITLNETIPNYNVMCFKTKVDSFDDNAWFAYGLRALYPDKQIYTQDAYYILMKKDIFELQKHGVIYETAPNNGIFTDGKWHDIKFGSITTENGINMYFEIDGKVIFDYLDKTNAQYRPGMFAMYISSGKPNGVELRPSDNIPDGLYTFSDKIIKEISTDASAGDTLDVSSKAFAQTGTWQDNTQLKGADGSAVKTTSEAGASAIWSMESGNGGNNKLYKVSYYHIPTANGDKNVKLKLSSYGGEYETTLDMSTGEEGWREIGTFNFIDADYIGRLKAEFTASGTGELNVSNIKFELVSEGENMLK